MTTTDNATLPRRKRIDSLDILRGLVIILMAIDHIRDLYAVTPQSPEQMDPLQPGWFFTRWITHFCAPTFMFLAGAAAFLYGNKINDKARLSRFLLTRGLWLILIELVVINPGFSFSLPHLTGFVFAQVIWAIGWSMIALAGLVWLPTRAVAVFSLALIFGHNLLDGITPESFGAFGWLWKMLHVGWGWIPFDETHQFGLLVIYPLIPWIAVMAIGYVFGQVMLWEQPRRFRFLLRSGLAATAIFILLRTFNAYGDANPWGEQDSLFGSVMSFLNTVKYPPSLQFLLMTLGPALLLLIPFERIQGRAAEFLMTFGRVPFFFYILHFPILSTTAIVWHYVRYGQYFNMFTTPPDQYPADYTPQVWLIYVVWVLFLIPMYFLCRWYWRYKSTHGYWWLSYV